MNEAFGNNKLFSEGIGVGLLKKNERALNGVYLIDRQLFFS